MDVVSFDEIRPLYHLRIDAPGVAAFFARHPAHRISKPSDGNQHVVFKRSGFDFLFRPFTGMQGGRTKHLRVLLSVFLFRCGEEGHEEFADVPFGIGFGDPRKVLVQKLGQPFASSLSIGLETLSWEKWRVEDLVLHAMFDHRSMTPRMFTISKGIE